MWTHKPKSWQCLDADLHSTISPTQFLVLRIPFLGRNCCLRTKWSIDEVNMFCNVVTLNCYKQNCLCNGRELILKKKKLFIDSSSCFLSFSIFKTFLTIRGLLSAKLVSNYWKLLSNRKTRPCVSLESRLTTFLLFFYHFCRLSCFSFFRSFSCSYWPSTRLCLRSRIFEKALTRQEMLTMD